MIFIIYTVNVYIIFYFLFFINVEFICIKQLLTIYIIIIGSQYVILNEEFNPQPVV